ncbi:MAG: Dephospho-CoA kinase [Planctomycetota bacterium]
MTSHTHPFRPTIGIVGGIGSGKSEVARAFAALGCEVCNSDDLARRVLAEPDVVTQITSTVPPPTGASSLLAPDGSIDRALLARAIFASADVRQRVERIMHPRIEALRRKQFASAPATTVAFIIDAPLLLEVGLDRECDAVVFVDAPTEMREERVARTRGWSREELDRRESAQLSLAEKRQRATDIVRNDGSPAELSASVARTLDTIRGRGPRVG